MTIAINNAFVSLIADDPTAAAAGEVLPSHWNASLLITQAGQRMLGKASSGAGPTTEMTGADVLAFAGAETAGAAAAAQAASQPLDSDLTAIAALTTTAYGRGFLTLADAAAATALLNTFTDSLKGLVPLSGGGTTNFLRADGAWAAAGAGDMTLAGTQTVTGAKTFGAAGDVGKLILAGSTSGSSILNAAAVAGSTTITLPSVTSTLATLGANTFTGIQTITPAVNAKSLIVTGVTHTDDAPIFDLAQTWNDAADTFTAIKLNVTATASATASMLLDLQAGGSTVTRVRKSGLATCFDLEVGGGAVALYGSLSNALSRTTSDRRFLAGGGAAGNGFFLSSDYMFGWSSNAGGGGDCSASVDLTLRRTAAGSLNISDNANGKAIGVKILTELLTIAAGVTSTTTIQKPADSIILSVSVRVTVAVTCTVGFTVGDSTNAARFNTAVLVSKAVNSTDKGTKAGAYYNATAEGIIITPDTTPSDATGRVRVTIHYIDVTPPTS